MQERRSIEALAVCSACHRSDPPLSHAEARSRIVAILTAIMMIVEIVAGTVSGSMALLADGWHMGTHVAALAITVLAYNRARRHASNPRFSFGTGKFGVLGGYTSGITLLVVAIVMAVESVQRLVRPVPIDVRDALLVAIIGLAVNLISAALLQHRPSAEHEDSHHHHHDHNLRAAYVHVLADALTSILAIVGLMLTQLYQWTWTDPTAGIVGAAVIARWSRDLIVETGSILLDGAVSPETAAELREQLERSTGDTVEDLHLWQIGPGVLGAIVSVVSAKPQPLENYRAALLNALPIGHLTVQVRVQLETNSQKASAAKPKL